MRDGETKQRPPLHTVWYAMDEREMKGHCSMTMTSSVALWLECLPLDWKVGSSIPGQVMPKTGTLCLPVWHSVAYKVENKFIWQIVGLYRSHPQHRVCTHVYLLYNAIQDSACLCSRSCKMVGRSRHLSDVTMTQRLSGYGDVLNLHNPSWHCEDVLGWKIHHMDAPGMCHQWCIPCSSGFRVTYTSYPSRKLGWPSRGWSSPDSRPSSYPRSVPLGQDQGHTICLSLTTLPELGGTILVHGGTRLCGLTPVQASPTSHQDHAALTRPRTCALHQTPSKGTYSMCGGLSRNGSTDSTGRETA